MDDTGTLRHDGARRGIRFERHLDASIQDVWAAITEPSRLERWLAPTEIDPRAGGDVHHDFGEGGVCGGDILVFEPPRLLEYEWRFDGESESIVRFELTEQDGGTRLVLDHRLLGTEQAPGYGAGWHAHLDRLTAVVAGQPIPGWDDRFGDMLPHYRVQAGA